ncbi:MAG TPA: MBL fold metallo-hydrolase [Syntrophales bacterium]|nr:MBL fold metallo-hydrolase [Syntrophales bacterium]
MRYRNTGKIGDHLWYLGREESGVYILEGREGAILINGGMSYILADVLQQIETFGIDVEKIRKILILHSHFDHVGIVPYFKRTYPKIEVYASGPAWKIFAMPKAIDVMNNYSRLSAKQVGDEDVLKTYDLSWRDDITGTVLAEGDKVELGSVALSIFDTPGHSNCSITAYESGMKTLFASDAVGVPYKNACFPSMNTNITQYLESLEKLKPLPVSCLCADHYGYITGEEAALFTELTIEEGRKWKIKMEDLYQRHGGDIELATKAITDYLFRQMPEYFVARDIMEGVFRQMLKFIAKNQ